MMAAPRRAGVRRDHGPGGRHWAAPSPASTASGGSRTPWLAGYLGPEAMELNRRIKARAGPGRHPQPRRRALALARVTEGGLHLQVLVEAEIAHSAPVSAGLVPAERCGDIEGVVDGHRTGADPARPPRGPSQVTGPDIARQTVIGIVGDLDGLVEIIVAAGCRAPDRRSPRGRSPCRW